MTVRFVPLDEDPNKVRFVPVDEPPQQDLTEYGGSAAAIAAVERVLGNIAAIPANLSERAADTLVGFPEPIQRMVDEAGVVSPVDRLSDATEALRPSGGAIESVLGLVGAGEQFGEFSEQLAEQNPVADSLGTLGGDVASLFGLRRPVKKAIERETGDTAGGILDRFVDDGLDRLANRAGQKARSTGFMKEAEELLNGENFRLLARGAGRSVETGLEAALLAGLQDQDPYEMAGYAAGAQMLSSAALTGGAASVELPAKVLFKQDVGRITKFGTALAIQGAILSSWINIFGDNPDAATEQAFDKLGFGLLSALTLGLPGKRPKGDGVLNNFPGAADAVLAIPRTAMNNAIIEVAGDERLPAVVELMETDPERMGAGEFRRMQQAVESGAFADWIGQVYERYNLGDTEDGMSAAAAAVPVRPRRNRGIGFAR